MTDAPPPYPGVDGQAAQYPPSMPPAGVYPPPQPGTYPPPQQGAYPPPQANGTMGMNGHGMCIFILFWFAQCQDNVTECDIS